MAKSKARAATSPIDTPAKRARLAPRKNPYWAGISGGRGGVSLGYRKPTKGAGSWLAKVVAEGHRREVRLGTSDDAGAAGEAMDFRAATAAALAWGEKQVQAVRDNVVAELAENTLTVRKAVTDYAADRVTRAVRAGKDAQQRLTKHVLSDAKLADLALSRVTAAALQGWRKRLPADMAPTTVNRLQNDLRAALNAAADAHRRQLPAHLPGEIKAGLKRVQHDAQEARKQVLTDADVRRVIEAAYTLDDDGDFGRLVLLAAATGARFSQLASITVADVQSEQHRIMVPASRKGRGDKSRPKVPVPVGADVTERLRPALAGRKGHEPLLMRWNHRQVSPTEWVKTERVAWRIASDAVRPWRRAAAAAGLPADTVMYALRHSSIVRGLRAGLPVRLVAALHDTSIAMIERHYAAFIVEATEDLVRRVVTPLAPSEPARLRAVGGGSNEQH